MAITASEKAADWARALQLLGTMQQLQVEANEYSYSAAISAAEKGLGENVEIFQGKIDPGTLEMYF